MKKNYFLALSAFILNTATAQTPTILKDIYSFENQSSIGISKFQYETSGSNVYFAASDILNGNELWKTNGTPAGTSLVKDIIEGSGNSNPEILTDVNGVLFFRATTAANGVELWKSDGTPEGTKLVKDIYEGAYSSYPDNLTNVNGVLYFMATTPSTGYELWKSDGTPEGTVMVKDIYEGSGGSNPMNLVNVNGTLFFSAAGSGSTSNYELWKSNGLAEGTILVKEIREGNTGSTLENFTNFNGSLFFSANDGIHGLELWKSDGTAEGTSMFKDINTTGIGSNSGAPRNFYVFKNNLYFSAFDGTNGYELWKSNGTPEGTSMLKDLDPGVGYSSDPKMFTAVGNTLYFVATGLNTGNEVWKTDGTAENTNIVADLIPGHITSDPQDLINYNGTLYFYTNGYQSIGNPFTHLWKSDGTAEGTIMIKDDVLGGGTFRSLYAGPNKIHFVYKGYKEGIPSTATGDEPWISDGTDGGTDILKDINTSNKGSDPAKFCKIGNTTFFTANDGLHGTELWKTDGTYEGTILVKDITEGTPSTAIDNLTAVNSTLYFTVNIYGIGSELWKSDGAPEGTVMLKDIFEGSRGSSPQNLKDVNGTLYFSAETYLEGREMWKSDGTPETTILVKDIMPGATSSNPNKFIYIDGTIFFTAQNGARSGSVDEELWKTDGTNGGTSKVKDIYPGIYSSTPDYLTNFKNTLYFSASDETGTQLWTSDGTESGTAVFKGFSGGSSMYPRNLTVIGNNLYYGGKTLEGGVGLWKTDGTPEGTIRVKQTSASGNYPADFILSNGQIFFTAYADGAGKELWKTNGSEAGTQLLKDLLPGSSSSNVELLTDFKGTLYFKASAETGISELWRSDGTADGTIIVEMNPTNTPANGSNPSGLIVMNDRLLFGATDFFKGAELWRIKNFALPLSLLDFTAQKNGEKVLLKWETTNEINTSVFEIERTGLYGFVKIGEVAAMNRSGDHRYSSYDESPLKGTNLYRLKMIDIDGSFTYSKIQRVDFNIVEQVRISPNPASNELNISNVTGYDLMQVIDASGRVVYQQKLTGDQVVVNIHKLLSGSYMVRLTGANIQKSLQFVKQ